MGDNPFFEKKINKRKLEGEKFRKEGSIVNWETNSLAQQAVLMRLSQLKTKI